jgi:hypothetical protein
MKSLFSIIFVFSVFLTFSQEHLSPVLFSKNQKQKDYSSQRGVTITKFEIDTLFLPFIDDFSSNKIKTYSEDTSVVDYTMNLSYGYSFDANLLNSFTSLQARDTSYALNWNSLNEEYDTTAQNPVEIISYNNNVYPALPLDTVYRWNAFTLRTDSLGVTDTTILVFNDTIWNNDINEFLTILDDESMWMDENSLSVYINNDYPINPPSLGVATFDAIDKYGQLNEDASTFVFYGDELTSKPIDLSGKGINDSIVLSFYYQPQGIGEFPSSKDSLILEFKSPEKGWTWQWSDEGSSYQNFVSDNGTSFKQVFIMVEDSIWLQKGFQFRFHNLASLAGNLEASWSSNADHWHIDYVVLDEKRDTANLEVEDVCFTESPKSMFVDYTQVPFHHYANRNQEILKDSLYNIGVNNSRVSSPKNVTYNLNIYEDASSLFQAGNYTINMEQDALFNFFGELDGLSLNSGETDSTKFFIEHSLATDANDLKDNDTLVFEQILKQVYAYDDGTAEAGYGISSNGGKVALAFNSIQDGYDTLQAIQIYFNQTINNANVQAFKLSVWQGNGIEPSDLLYQSENLSPEYSLNNNTYVTYLLDTTVMVGGEFYIGWEQNHEELLNVGFDLNADLNGKLMYSIAATGGTWSNSSFSGALMMRPIIGNEYAAPMSVKTKNTLVHNNILLYPNPVENILNIEIKGNTNFRVYNSVGQLITSGDINKQHQLDVNTWSKGLYFFQSISKGNIQTERFIVE